MSSSSSITPSAKSHERVTGRWIHEVREADPNQWAIYYVKSIFGTPIPWLMAVMAMAVFISRFATEVAAWSTCGLLAMYVAADRFSQNREFHFYRLGGDFMLLGLVGSAVLGAVAAGSIDQVFDAVGSLRWIALMYLLSYSWELFPGLNRAYGAMAIAAATAVVYGIWQHFMGIDLLSGAKLAVGPVTGHAYFAAVGFFSSPEAFGTVLGVFLPLPAMAFLLGEQRDLRRWAMLALTLACALALFFTYRPGLWTAGGCGLFVALLLPGRRQWALALSVLVLVGSVQLVLYDTSGFWKNVGQAQAVRSSQQRTQINQQVKIWSDNPWVGGGIRSVEAARLDSTVGNVYFQILAQAGALGLSFYLLFCLGFLLGAYRILQEIPRTHYWHRVLVSGGIAGQVAFHVAGLYWFTLNEGLTTGLFAFIVASLSYVHEHYSRGLVSDDYSL